MSIPIENYLNIRAAYGPSFSPDGRRLAFLTNITGIPQAWAMDAQGGWPDQLTFGERVSGAWYAPSADRLVFARDVGGNENAQLYLIQGDGSGERRLTHDDGAMHTFGGWSPDGRSIAFSANRRDRGRYDLYVQDVDAGEARMVWQNEAPGIVFPTGFAPDGTRLLVLFMHSSLNQDLYEIDLMQRMVRHLTPHSGDVQYRSPAYADDGRSVYCACDLGREFTGVMRLDLADLSLHPVAQPEWDVEHLALTRDGRFLAWCTNVEGSSTLTLRDLHSGETRGPTAQALPAGQIAPASDLAGLVFSPDGRQLAFSLSTSRRTSDVWLWDVEANSVRPVTRSSHAGIPTSSFVAPERVRYSTFDGRAIPAWFYRPQAGGRRPVVVYVHGGPESQFCPRFLPDLQYLLARGYAVFAPNVRGSTGYGKTYCHLDDVEKRMDAVADLAHGVYWLRAQPDVDPARIAVYGASYGGFMVLSALTTYPDLWAAGVDIVGIGNWVTFLQNTSAYRRSAREAEYGSLARDREFLTRVSPIHHIERIKAPLMVIHGANDPRVPCSEAEQIVVALRARNIPVEFLIYADEGHGLIKLANRLDAYPKIAAFLERYVGG